MSSADSQYSYGNEDFFGNPEPSLGLNNPNPNAGKEANLRQDKLAAQQKANGAADNYNDSEVADGESLRDISLRGQKNQAKQGSLLTGNADKPSSGGTGAIDFNKPFASAGGLSAFFLLPEMSQIGYFTSSSMASWGFAIPLWDGFCIWAVMFGKTKPKVGFSLVVLFWSLIFWISLAAIIFLIIMILSFIMMGPVDKATVIWNFGFGTLSGIIDLFTK